MNDDKKEANSYPYGSILKERRLQLRLTLENISKASALSISFLSQIESGNRAPRHSVLVDKILPAYHMNIDDLTNPTDVVQIMRASEKELLSRSRSLATYVSKNTLSHANMLPTFAELSPGETSGKLEGHAGEECVCILEGTVIFYFDDHRLHCSEGDVIHFKSTKPHFIENKEKISAHLLIVRNIDRETVANIRK